MSGRLRRLARWWMRADGRTRAVSAVLAVTLFLVVGNWLVHVIRKPSELAGLATGASPRTPRETWRDYGSLFRRHSTDVLTPSLLAALVQVESSGDPTARTYWRWRFGANPLEWYGPASSAVGLLQITDATFAEARRYCIHDHKVARAGAVTDLHGCWFNALYSRLLPSHAIEMTSAWLTRAVEELLGPSAAPGPLRQAGPAGARDVPPAGLRGRQDLATSIHLCGYERGRAFVRHGLRAMPGERCGDHSLAEYLARVRTLDAEFRRLEAAP